MITDANPKRIIKSDKTVLDIIEYVKEHQQVTVTDIATDLGISKSTAHGHLATLEKRGYVFKEDNEYRLGLLFIGMGQYVQHRIPSFEVVKTAIERLAENTSERTQFMLEEHGRGFFVYRAQGENAVQVGPPIGDPRYLHDSACGKAILAALPEERLEAILSHWGLPSRTPHTLTNRDRFEEELETVRTQQYAENVEESRLGLYGIGTSIADDDGLVGSISISGPISRLDERHDEMLNKLLGTANEIELNLKNY